MTMWNSYLIYEAVLQPMNSMWPTQHASQAPVDHGSEVDKLQTGEWKEMWTGQQLLANDARQLHTPQN